MTGTVISTSLYVDAPIFRIEELHVKPLRSVDVSGGVGNLLKNFSKEWTKAKVKGKLKTSNETISAAEEKEIVDDAQLIRH